MRIDAHHHLWHYTEREFSWIGDESAILRRDFLPVELENLMAAAGVDAAVAVQARSSLEETRWLLQSADDFSRIAAVVGWAPLDSPELPRHLDTFGENRFFAGLREIAQDQPAGFLLQPAFADGIGQLTARNLTYDILIRAGQLGEALEFVDRHPKQQFVLDHAAKPAIAGKLRQPWQSLIQQLAERPHVLCKLSGLVTEADWQRWTEDDLEPYLDTCLEAFGPRRCMAGSDWPVCLVATTYERWWRTLERWAQRLSPTEQEQVLGGTAAAVYGIEHASLTATTQVSV